MTYHRTGGKGGTRNSVRERHADRFLPNFNKSTTRGHSRPARKGRRKDNPPTSRKDTSTQERFADTMKKAREAGVKPRRTALDRILGGKSDVTDW